MRHPAGGVRGCVGASRHSSQPYVGNPTELHRFPYRSPCASWLASVDGPTGQAERGAPAHRGLHFELCTFASAAPDQFESPSSAADARHWQRCRWQRADPPARRRSSRLAELRLRLAGASAATPARLRQSLPRRAVVFAKPLWRGGKLPRRPRRACGGAGLLLNRQGLLSRRPPRHRSPGPARARPKRVPARTDPHRLRTTARAPASAPRSPPRRVRRQRRRSRRYGPQPAADDRLRMWPVSRRANKTGTGDDDPTLIEEKS
jgi:hypothetical protein